MSRNTGVYRPYQEITNIASQNAFAQACPERSRRNVALSEAPGLGEGLEAAVVAPLNVVGKTTAGKLLHRQMITDTLTTITLLITAGIRTIALLEVLFFLAFHGGFLLLVCQKSTDCIIL